MMVCETSERNANLGGTAGIMTCPFIGIGLFYLLAGNYYEEVLIMMILDFRWRFRGCL